MTLPPPEGHVVREATVRDADELARLRWQFRVEAGTPRSISVESFVDEMVSFVREALGGQQWNAFVAERGGRLVGCVWVQFVERVPHPNLRRGERPIAYITNTYVEPALRNRGVGRALLDAAVGSAQNRGASGAILWPSERSVPFYRRAGFGDEDAPLALPLEGD
jgi:ribosomal protein S18 acetylase RimI-like enzyme